ncbi:MAG TPA: hypothetical protein DCE42_16125 [Myxococcales bacterium]|nr:hypothetical protein [Deltaproteobacteria bacterium]HAA56292.1 hypothetical protein [Myxococcales bacterium]
MSRQEKHRLYEVLLVRSLQKTKSACYNTDRNQIATQGVRAMRKCIVPIFLLLSLSLVGHVHAKSTWMFPIKVTAQTAEHTKLPYVLVMVNENIVGTTNRLGVYYGSYRGKEGQRIKIRVQGIGKDNELLVTRTLSLRKTNFGKLPRPIFVRAVLRKPGTPAPRRRFKRRTPYRFKRRTPYNPRRYKTFKRRKAPTKRPEGFPIRVIVLNTQKVGLSGALVYINRTLVGRTNISGFYMGHYKGKVGERIQIRVQAPGPDNYILLYTFLRKEQTGPQTVYVTAHLRGDDEPLPPYLKKKPITRKTSPMPRKKPVIRRKPALRKKPVVRAKPPQHKRPSPRRSIPLRRRVQKGPRKLFLLKVTVQTPFKKPIPDAQIYVDGKLLGSTNFFGIYVGMYRGVVGSDIKIRVQRGPNNKSVATRTLRMYKGSKTRTQPIELKIFLWKGKKTTRKPAKMPPKKVTHEKAHQMWFFPVKVIAMTSNKQGITGARVYANKKLIGKTNRMGLFYGVVKGYTGQRIRFRVSGHGKDNYMLVTTKLKMRSVGGIKTPSSIKIEAYLRSTPPSL